MPSADSADTPLASRQEHAHAPTSVNRPSTRRTVVAVRPETVRGKRRWVVAWRVGGKLRRQFFASRTDAEEAADIRRGDDGAVIDEIRAHGLTLRAVWEGYLAGHKPPEAPRGPTLGQVVEEVIRAKSTGGRSTRYVAALRGALSQFMSGRESHRIGLLTTKDVESWLASKAVVSRSTLRARLSAMFSFAVRRGYCPDNPCDRLESVRVARPVPAVFSVRQAAKALVWTRRLRPKCLGAFVLTLLCGLRPEEAQATTWEAIRLDAPDGAHVVVEAQTSKVRQRRVVYPMAAGVAWLRVAKRQGSSLPLNREAWRRFIRDLRDVLGWKEWPKDVTRHTAASYWLAAEPHVYRVAEQLGHSPAILKTHYRALVTRADAERFWRLVPRGAAESGAAAPGRADRSPTPLATGPA